MWFYLGLFTVSVSLIIYLYQKLSIQSALQLRQSGLNILTYDNTQYKSLLKNATSKNRGLFAIEIPCLTTLQFSARKELHRDKWAKRLGVSYEFETGSQVFDEQTYLASITQEDAEIIGTNKQIMTAIRHLIFESKDFDFEIVTKRTLLICDGKQLYLELHFRLGSSEKETYSLATYFLPKLTALANQLKSHKRETQHFWKVPIQRNTAILLAISLALATWGGLEAARFFILDKNALFSPLSLIPEAIALTLLGLLSLVFLAFRLIKKSARRHLILLDLVIFGGLGLLFTIYGLLYDLNTMNDDSEATIVNYQVIDKYSVKHRGRKGRTYYTYHLNLKDALAPIESPMKVSSNFYNEINSNDIVSFTIRDGFLQKTWLENMYKCPFCTVQSNSQQKDF